MKTALILSDTHGDVLTIGKLREIMVETDYVIHLGDVNSDIARFKAEFPQKVITVAGNCDGGRGYKVIDIEGVKILLTHGHDYGVKSGLTRLNYFAQEIGANVVFYGHTHQSNLTTEAGITFANPGTFKGFFKSYAYAVFNDKKHVIKIVDLVK